VHARSWSGMHLELESTDTYDDLQRLIVCRLRLFHLLLIVGRVRSEMIAGRRYGLTKFFDDASTTKSRRKDFRMRPNTMIRPFREMRRVGVMDDE
jgi:hypothetical protein